MATDGNQTTKTGRSSARASWERLSELLDRADRAGLASLSLEELEALGSLYRQAATHLARARTDGRDPDLVEFLNSLVGRAHGRLYGGRTKSRFQLGHFFGAELPRTFRRNFWYIALSVGISLLAAVVAYIAVCSDDRWARAMLPQGAAMIKEFAQSKKAAGEYFADAATAFGGGGFSGFLMLNNIQVALRAFAFGISAGIGTIVVLVMNGLMLGAFLGIGAVAGRLTDLVAVVTPHGVVELSAIFIAGGAGLMMGHAIIDPGDRLRRDAIVRASREAVKLAVGTVPMFVCAGLIEGLISPQYEGLFASNFTRITFGWLMGGIWFLYLFAGDHIIAAMRGKPTTAKKESA